MRFGVYVPNIREFGDPPALVVLARLAEEHGWGGFFIWDHLFMGDSSNVADATTTLGAIAAVTCRIQIGALITPIARRRPWKVARETASLAALAPGRVVLGIGLGMQADYDWFAGELDTERERVEPTVEGTKLLRALLTGGPTPVKDHPNFLRKPDKAPDEISFTPSATDVRMWGAARINRDGSDEKLGPFRRAEALEGIFPVADDWQPDDPLSTEELRRAVRLTWQQDQVPAGCDLVTTGQRDSSGAIPEYDALRSLGVTWWLETIPQDWSVRTAEALIRQGPPYHEGSSGR